MDLLNATDSSPCSYVDRLSSLACLTLVRSDCLFSCSLWRRLYSLAPDAICLSHSVDSSALSYTVRNLPSYSVDLSHRSFSTCATLKCTCTFVSIRSIKIFGTWPHVRRQTYRHTDIHTRLAMLRLAPSMW